jgi:hypothetical protein
VRRFQCNVAFTYSSSVESAMALENQSMRFLNKSQRDTNRNAADFNEAQPCRRGYG